MSLTPEEKEKIVQEEKAAHEASTQLNAPASMLPLAAPSTDLRARKWGMMCHFAAFVPVIGLPLGNIILPLLIWYIFRKRDASVVQHGKEALAFQISVVVYMLAGTLLLYFAVGGLILVVVALLNCILAAWGSIRAIQGRFYQYPAVTKAPQRLLFPGLKTFAFRAVAIGMIYVIVFPATNCGVSIAQTQKQDDWKPVEMPHIYPETWKPLDCRELEEMANRYRKWVGERYLDALRDEIFYNERVQRRVRTFQFFVLRPQ